MAYLVSAHSFALALALLVGVAVGYFTWSRVVTANRWGGWVPVAGALYAFALILAVTKVVPRTAGYWLDVGLLLIAAYLFGCLVGALLAGLRDGFVPAFEASAYPRVWPSLADRPFTAGTATAFVAPSAPLAAAAPAIVSAAAPAVAQPSAGRRPPEEPRPEGGEGDNLTLIRGIGPRNEAILHDRGIWRFRQIAAWTPEDATWVNGQIAFPGRVEREHWIDQARLLSAGVDTPHAVAVKSGQVVPQDDPVPEAEASAMLASLPAIAPPGEADAEHGGHRPLSLVAPMGAADDLKRISGIGRQNEARLNGLGIWHFSQIAAWSDEHVGWVSSYLAFPGRIEREEWVSQARILATGGETHFSKRVDKGEVPTSSSGPA